MAAGASSSSTRKIDTIIASAGLFLILSAEFMAFALIIVYAGAILITYLFVIMLAKPEGSATYDRISWANFPQPLSLLVAAAMVGNGFGPGMYQNLSSLFVPGMTTVDTASSPTATADAGDGYIVERHGDAVAGEESTVEFTALVDGRVVDDIQTYLGALGHLVVLREGDLAYLHVHADDHRLSFETEFPSAGTYRLLAAQSNLNGSDVPYMFQWFVGAPPAPSTGTQYVYYGDFPHLDRVALSSDHAVEPILIDGGASGGHLLGHRGGEGDHVVLDLALDLLDPGEVEIGVRAQQARRFRRYADSGCDRQVPTERQQASAARQAPIEPAQEWRAAPKGVQRR